MGEAGASGTKLSIGTTAAVGSTDTYTDLGSLDTLGEYGVDFAEILFEDLTLGTVSKYKGARNDGDIAVGLGMDLGDAGQIAMKAALLDKADYNFKITYNDSVVPVSAVATISNASPGVVTWTAHGLVVNTAVHFTTTGTLPTGLSPSTTYYVKTVLDANTFTLSATKGGSAIATSSAGSGVHTIVTEPASTFDLFKAKVRSYKTTVGGINSVVKAAVSLSIKSGSLVTTAKLPAS